jgi:hypothetical protein
MFQYENGFNITEQRRHCKGKEEKVSTFIVYKTLLKVGNQYA